jgi:DNA-directed RNA polymerase subunit D
MKIQKIDSKEGSRFVISDTTPSFVNALRRACSFETPILAIEDVYFTQNSSALYDEIVSHRLGLIPLKTDLKTYGLQENCKCKSEGCARCQVKLSLKAKGPAMVLAKDLKSTDPQIKPVFPETPIVELLEGQEIEFEAIAILGSGKEHVKWSAGHTFYQRYPKISITAGKKVKEGISYCPKKVFKGEKVAELLNCNLCLSCQEHSDGAIKITSEDNKFLFTVESWGQITDKEMLQQATNILKQKTADVKVK